MTARERIGTLKDRNSLRLSAAALNASRARVRAERQHAVIRFANIEVPRAAIAELAARLHQARRPSLARHLGNAIDHHADELVLTPSDVTVILRELSQERDPALDEFRSTLEAQQRYRSARDTGAAELTTSQARATRAV